MNNHVFEEKHNIEWNDESKRSASDIAYTIARLIFKYIVIIPIMTIPFILLSVVGFIALIGVSLISCKTIDDFKYTVRTGPFGCEFFVDMFKALYL